MIGRTSAQAFNENDTPHLFANIRMASLMQMATASKTSAPHDRLAITDDRELDGFEIAGQHPLVRTKPGPTYFEGMLLGNGDMGVCAVVRPDALGFHISKSDCWDIRVTEGK